MLSNNNKTPANLNLTYPTSGLALNSGDFPLPIKMITLNPEQIVKIEIKLKNELNNEEHIVNTINLVENREIETIWSDYPAPGEYKLYAEFYNWNGLKKQSNQISININ